MTSGAGALLGLRTDRGRTLYVVYADDSAQKGFREGQGKLIGLGAAAFPEEHIKPFTDDYYACYDKFGVPHDVELKWSPDPKKDWFRIEGKTELIQPFREAILDVASAHEVKAFAAIWDDGAQKTMQGYGPEYWVIKFLIERVTMFLERAEHRGVIVFDKPGGNHKDEDAWITDTRELTDIGTEYVKASAVVAPVLTAPSHHHPQLQLADLIAGVAVGAFAGNRYALSLLPKLKSMFHTGFWGMTIGGTGVKLYPDSVCNLYYWVLGDDMVVRRGMGTPLPYDGLRRYVENDGLARP